MPAQPRARRSGSDADDVACGALARFVLEAVDLTYRHPDSPQVVDTIFTLLEHGWSATHPGT